MKRLEPLYHHLSELQHIVEALPQTNTQQQQLNQTFNAIYHQLGTLKLNVCPIEDHVQCRLSAEALRQSEERFRVALKNSPITVFTQDTNLHYTWIYNPIEEFTTEMIVGHGDHDLFSPEGAQVLTQLKQQVLTTGIGTRQEVLLQLGQDLRAFDLTIEPLLNCHGTLTGITCAATDITSLKQVEAEIRSLNAELEQRVFDRTEALNQMNQELQSTLTELQGMREVAEIERQRYLELYDFYRTVVEDQTELICRYQPDGTLTFVNEALCRYVQMPQAQLVGQSIMDFVIPDDREQLATYLASLDQDNPVGDLERRSLLSNGEVRWQHWYDRALFNDQGELVAIQSVGRDISKRKHIEAERQQLEQALQESESRLRTILEQVQGAISSFQMFDNLTWNYAYHSPGCEAVFGYNAQEMTSNPMLWASRVLPEDWERKIIPSIRAIQAEQTFTTEYRFYHKDGSQRWASTTTVSRRDPANKCWVVTAIDMDITDRKRMEEALQQSEERYRLIAKNFPNGTLQVFDHHCRYLLTDGQELDKIGLSCELVEGKTLWEIFPSELAVVLEPHYRAALAGQHSVFEMQLQGQHYLVNTLPLKNADGDVIAGMSSSQNITSLKQAEAALRDSEERFRQLAENIEGVFWLVDLREKKLIYVSPAYEKIWGRRLNTHLDYRNWYSTIHPDDLGRVIGALQNSQNGPTEIEYRIVRPDGSLRWIQDKGFPIRDHTGEIYRCAGVAEDITVSKHLEESRQQAESALRDSESRLKASLTEKEVLLREIHHRVKNNLQVIASLLRLQSRRVNDSAIQAVLEDSENRVISMALVHENLYQSQDLSQINFSQYIHSLAANLFQTYQRSGQTQLQVKLDDQIRLGLEKAVPCGLIINELMTNALKHGCSTSCICTIGVKMTIAAQHIVLSVSNTGDFLPVNFDLNHVKSMGLRLVMVLAEQLEGTVELERGDQTEFKIVFPHP